MIIEPRTLFFDVPVVGKNEIHKLAVYEWGNATNVHGTVFCVHGLTRNGRDFDVLASALSANYRVYSIDMAGRGRSQWHNDPAHYSYENYVTDIKYLINKLELNDINWIGTSMGGIIGMMIANTFPKLLKTLVLNDIGCLIPTSGLTRISSYISAPTNFKSRILAENELRLRCAPYGIKNEEHWQNLFLHSIQEIDNMHVRLAYDPNIAINFSTTDHIQDVNLWSLWEMIKTIPTLLIRGMQSDLLTHQTAIEMKQTHPDLSLLEIDNAGHAPALMDELQISAIKNWIRT